MTTYIGLSILLISIILLIISIKKLSGVSDAYKKTKSDFKQVDEILLQQMAIDDEYTELQNNYSDSKDKLKKAERKISQYELGIGTVDKLDYKLLYSGENLTLEFLEDHLDLTKRQIKESIKEKKACKCKLEGVTVNGKKSEATKLINREIKLRIRCFDNEVKSAIALSNWNNINRLISRVEDTFESINRRGELMETTLQEEYKERKIRELRLLFEIAELKEELKQQEREERRIEREAEREEAKIQKAADKAKTDRERMEKLVAKELAKLDSMNDEQRQLLELHQQELALLEEKESRAVSMAQQTRAGYVYIISNPMSFGNDIVKIGMTRRVDPYERVRELGDASVPDVFDVHAMFYCEDAPSLESQLHSEFDEHRLNLVNKRKEFFKVPFDRVISTAENLGVEVKRTA